MRHALPVMAALAGCGSAPGAETAADAGPGDGGSACPATHEAAGAAGACAPIFDECGDNESAPLGGGCERVGPAAGCWPGWTDTDEGGCAPILPEAPCPDGAMEIIGEAVCAPVGDCGEGTWGNLDDAGALHVSAAYEGADSDGTAARPFLTIGEALAAASAGGRVVVAAGDYAEDLVIDFGVTLEGRCPQMVTIRGVSDDYPAVLIGGVGTLPIVVRGVTVTGPYFGLAVVSRENVALEGVVAAGAADRGVQIQRGSSVTLRRALIAGNVDSGIFAYGATVVAEDVVVRDTRSGEFPGRGVQVTADDAPGDITLRRVLVDRNGEAGVAIFDGTATLEEVVVRDTLSVAATGLLGRGLYVQAPATAEVRRSLVEASRDAGAVVVGARAVFEDVIVRDTRGQEADGLMGAGLSAQVDPAGAPADVTLRRCLFAVNHDPAVFVTGATATIDETVVRDTLSVAATGLWGSGLLVQADPTMGIESSAEIARSVFSGNRSAGIIVHGASATIEDVVVRDTLGDEVIGAWGGGLYVERDAFEPVPSRATVRRVLLERNRQVGFFVWGASAEVEDCEARDTAAGPSAMGDGIGVARRREDGDPPSRLDLARSSSRDNDRIGVFFYDAAGSLSGTAVRGNALAVLLEEGADPTIAADNWYDGNDRDEVVVGQGLMPPPPADHAP